MSCTQADPLLAQCAQILGTALSLDANIFSNYYPSLINQCDWHVAIATEPLASLPSTHHKLLVMQHLSHYLPHINHVIGTYVTNMSSITLDYAQHFKSVYFNNNLILLTWLTCSDEELTQLLSSLTQLTRLSIRYCYSLRLVGCVHPTLSELDVTGSVAVGTGNTSKSTSRQAFHLPSLKKLRVSLCTSITEFYFNNLLGMNRYLRVSDVITCSGLSCTARIGSESIELHCSQFTALDCSPYIEARTGNHPPIDTNWRAMW